MLIEIDFNSDEAIYIQLRNQIIMGIAAVNVYAQDSTSKKYVTDNAGILTDDEISKLEKLCSKSSDDCKTDIYCYAYGWIYRITA
jgi:hypothetical protein